MHILPMAMPILLIWYASLRPAAVKGSSFCSVDRRVPASKSRAAASRIWPCLSGSTFFIVLTHMSTMFSWALRKKSFPKVAVSIAEVGGRMEAIWPNGAKQSAHSLSCLSPQGAQFMM